MLGARYRYVIAPLSSHPTSPAPAFNPGLRGYPHLGAGETIDITTEILAWASLSKPSPHWKATGAPSSCSDEMWPRTSSPWAKRFSTYLQGSHVFPWRASQLHSLVTFRGTWNTPRSNRPHGQANSRRRAAISIVE